MFSGNSGENKRRTITKGLEAINYQAYLPLKLFFSVAILPFGVSFHGSYGTTELPLLGDLSVEAINFIAIQGHYLIILLFEFCANVKRIGFWTKGWVLLFWDSSETI